MAKLNFHFSIKSLLLLGFLFVVLLVIPLTVYLVQQQQETRSQAAANTTLKFDPPTTRAEVGDNTSFDIMLIPGSNNVVIIKLVIKFDPTKLKATEESFKIDPASNLSVLEKPVVDANTYAITISVGIDNTKAIQTDTRIGTMNFEVIGGDGTSTEISFDPTIKINSTDNADGPSENVYLGGSPATINIGSEADITPVIGTTGNNSAPVCSALNIAGNASTTGVAPYTLTFNVKGSDTDGKIENIKFTFETDSIKEISSASADAKSTIDHSEIYTYENIGVHTASVVLTDDDGTKSTSVNCSKTITITDDEGNTTSTNNSAGGTNDDDGNDNDDSDLGDDEDGSGSTGTTDSDPSEGIEDDMEATPIENINPSPLPATGPEEAIVGVGVLGGILFLIGTLLFFAL